MAKVSLRISKAADPVKPAIIGGPRVPINRDFDLRDKLSELAIKGSSLAPDDKAAIYGYLTANLGKDKAMKLMNHAYIFNSKPDIQRLSPEEKLKSFYTIGSSDPDVMEVISRTKNLGYGVLPGFRNSVSSLNQEIQGNNPDVTGKTVNPEVTRRVRLQINK